MEKSSTVNTKALTVIVLFSILCTAIPAILAFHITKTYYSNFPYVPDPAGAMVTNMIAYEHLSHSTRFETALDQLNTNHKYPFRTIPLILLAPKLLVNPWGQMFTLLPLFTIFLYLLGYSIYKRTGNHLGYTLTMMLLFSTSTVLYSPYYGLASYLLDLTAGLPLASAALCFTQWHETRKQVWLVYFSIFISIAILCRYIVLVYAGILFTPLIVYSCYMACQLNRNIYRNLIRPLLTIFFIIGLTSGYFIITQFRWNLEYYSYWKSLRGVTMNVGFFESIYSYVYNYFGFFARYHTILIALILLFNAYLAAGMLKKKKAELAMSSWCLLALPCYWILSLGTNGFRVAAAYLAAFPIMFISLVSPVHWGTISGKAKFVAGFCLIIFLFSILSASRAYHRMMIVSTTPSPGLQDMKDIQIRAAAYMNDHPGNYILNNFLCRDHLNYGIWLEHCYRYGGRPKYDLTNSVFIPEKGAAEILYQGLSAEDIADSIMNQINRQYNFIIAFENPEELSYSDIFTDTFSCQLAIKLSQRIKLDSNWKKTERMKTLAFKELAFYSKTTTR